MLRALNTNSQLRALRLPRVALATGSPSRFTSVFFSSSSASASNAASPVSEMYLADAKAPICSLKVQSRFEALPTVKAREYAHAHGTCRAHAGTRVVLRQVSAESEAIYDLHHEDPCPRSTSPSSSPGKPDYVAVFANDSISKEQVQQYLDYASQFLSNLGNYKSFGDTKLVPRRKPGSISGASNQLPMPLRHLMLSGTRSTVPSPEKANLLGHLDQGHVTTYFYCPRHRDPLRHVRSPPSRL